jgi:hypothetical protein
MDATATSPAISSIEEATNVVCSEVQTDREAPSRVSRNATSIWHDRRNGALYSPLFTTANVQRNQPSALPTLEIGVAEVVRLWFDATKTEVSRLQLRTRNDFSNELATPKFNLDDALVVTDSRAAKLAESLGYSE